MGSASGLEREVRSALLKEWDPIGIKEIAEAANEYDAYAPALAEMLRSKRSEAEIFDYLWQLETGHMGLTGDREATKKFASYLSELYGGRVPGYKKGLLS